MFLLLLTTLSLFLSLTQHIFPPQKEKRDAHMSDGLELEAHRPRGILKSGWFTKHAQIVAALTLMLFEWDEVRVTQKRSPS